MSDECLSVGESRGGAECSDRAREKTDVWASLRRDLHTHPGDCWLFPSQIPSSWSRQLDSGRRC